MDCPTELGPKMHGDTERTWAFMGPVVPKKTEGTAHLHEAFMHQDAAKPFYGLLGKDTAGRWFQNFEEWKGPHWLMSPYAIWLAKDGELVSFRFRSRYFISVDVENTQISPFSQGMSAHQGSSMMDLPTLPEWGRKSVEQFHSSAWNLSTSVATPVKNW